MKFQFGFVSIFLLVLAVSQTGKGQDAPLPNDAGDTQDQAPDQTNPEDRNHGVARVSLLNGDVSVRRGDSGDQVAAAINAPLLALDVMTTGPASRAEIQFDTANRVRFGNDTEIRISELMADRFQIQIARGTMTWAVLGEGSAQGEISTPSVVVRPLGRGDYRISVLPDGTTQITARSGNLEISTPKGVERVAPGQTMLARGAVDNPEFQTTTAIGRDEWDVFNERRDRELQQSQSYNYVSRDIAGAEDLDNYGQWNNDPSYGQVWTPRVAADWSPYRLGRWGYEDYYGWTWLSSDPWGWAPYHYGSWFRGNYGWSWYPGARYGHHYYYRPALVAFFGFGGGGVGLGSGNGWGFGNVGWVPLAPFERYHPWYGRGFSQGFGRSGSFYNTGNVTNLYRNARVGNGVMGLSSRDFASGHFGRYSNPTGSQLQQAGMIRGQMPFSPTSNHFRFNDRQTAVQGRTNFGQTRFAGNAPAQHGSFGRQTSGFNQNFNRQATQEQGFGSFGRSQSGTVVQNGQSSRGGDSNWQRFGSPNRSVPSQGQFGRQQYNSPTRQQGSFASRPPQSQSYRPSNNESGWQRFGNPGSARQNFNQTGQSNGFNSYRQSSGGPQYQRGSAQSVQVSPPVIRERESQYGGGRYGSNQPSYRQPNYGQPNRTFGQQSSPSSSRPSYQSSPRNENRSFQPRQESSHSFSQGSHSSGNGSRGNESRGHR